MARASAIMGIVGGVLGLLTSAFGFLLSLVLLVVTFGGATFLFLPMLVDGLGAVLGIIGGGVALSRPKSGGWVLLIGVAIGFAGWLVSLRDAVGKGVGATTMFFLLLVFFLWWALLMLIGGLLAIAREPARSASPSQT